MTPGLPVSDGVARVLRTFDGAPVAHLVGKPARGRGRKILVRDAATHRGDPADADAALRALARMAAERAVREALDHAGGI